MLRTCKTSIAWLLPLLVASQLDASTLYYTHWDWEGAIHCIDTDTMEIGTPIPTGVLYPFRIAVDPIGQKMYWLESYVAQVCRANVDGSEIEVIAQCETSG